MWQLSHMGMVVYIYSEQGLTPCLPFLLVFITPSSARGWIFACRAECKRKMIGSLNFRKEGLRISIDCSRLPPTANQFRIVGHSLGKAWHPIKSTGGNDAQRRILAAYLQHKVLTQH